MGAAILVVAFAVSAFAAVWSTRRYRRARTQPGVPPDAYWLRTPADTGWNRVATAEEPAEHVGSA